eukprot:1910703-Rhodomonas_salina.1
MVKGASKVTVLPSAGVGSRDHSASGGVDTSRRCSHTSSLSLPSGWQSKSTSPTLRASDAAPSASVTAPSESARLSGGDGIRSGPFDTSSDSEVSGTGGSSNITFAGSRAH